MACVAKAASACSHMTWRIASHPLSANTTRRATAPMVHAAGKAATTVATEVKLCVENGVCVWFCWQFYTSQADFKLAM